MSIKELVTEYRYPICGGMLGLLFALLIIMVGFLKTLLIIICIVVGVYVSSYLKQTGIIEMLLSKK